MDQWRTSGITIVASLYATESSHLLSSSGALFRALNQNQISPNEDAWSPFGPVGGPGGVAQVCCLSLRFDCANIKTKLQGGGQWIARTLLKFVPHTVFTGQLFFRQSFRARKNYARPYARGLAFQFASSSPSQSQSQSSSSSSSSSWLSQFKWPDSIQSSPVQCNAILDRASDRDEGDRKRDEARNGMKRNE